MKTSIRKFLSGVAAVAIALGGLALGVGSAQAADANGTITVTADNGTAGHTLTAYKIAAYNSGTYSATSAGKLDTTTFNYIVDSSDESAIESALDKAGISASASGTLTKAQEGLKQLSEDSSGTPYGYKTGTNTGEKKERLFADALAEKISSTDAATKWTPSYSAPVPAVTGTNTFSATLPEGLYLILDTYRASENSANSTQSVPMIVGTTFANTKITDPGNVGTVTLKDTTAPITKEVVTKNSTAQDNDPSSFTTDNDPSYNTTDTVYFKLTTTIPNYDGYASDPTLNNPNATRQLSIVDTFEAGKFTDQTVVSVYDTTKNQKLTLDSDFTTKAEPTTSSATDLNKLTINFERLVNKAQADTTKNLGVAWDGWESGDTITVIVSGKLSTAATATTAGSTAGTGADTLGSNNTVQLEYSNNPSDTSSKTTVQGPIVNVYTHQFTINKIKADGTALPGATFQVSTGSTPLKFTKDADGAYVVNKDDKNATTDLVSGEDGKIVVKGVKASADGVTYTVTETKVPDGGYLQSVAPSYTVTLKDVFKNDKSNPARASKTATQAGDDWLTELKYGYTQDGYKLVTASADTTDAPTGDTAYVKNVTSITQLPKTGAAGIAMFTVIGVAVVAVAALFAVRARKAAQRV
ncbi:LPXTG cell wall anchor domain-containing protein [Bifidobacterium thermacidophilum]|uniref:LPXTG cell wall anchor domain-containing protein n=1 Tax=Bifidobacterium thermacidophilum TaxID=246618 RepID=UPI003F07E60E